MTCICSCSREQNISSNSITPYIQNIPRITPMKIKLPFTRSALLAVLVALAACLPGQPSARAADHGDAPTLAHDQGADIADFYFFLDPNDTTQAVLIGTFHGFIVAGEAANFALFDPALRYRFEIYNDHVNLALTGSST